MSSGYKPNDTKAGCTLMVSCELFTERVLKPFMVLDGTWGGKLMNEYNKRSSSVVVFNKKHWMDSNAFIVYLEMIRRTYSGKVLLVVDHFSGHYSEAVTTFLKEVNNDAQKLEVLMLPKGMTSVLQVGDVGVNALLKEKVRSRYRVMVSDFRREQSNKMFKLDQREFKIGREKFIEMVENVFQDLNTKERGWLRKVFQKCGQDPVEVELCQRAFETHLQNLKGGSGDTTYGKVAFDVED